MKASIARAFRGLQATWAAQAPKPRTHLIWRDLHESDEDVEVRKREWIESGRAKKNDRFVVCGWKRPAAAPSQT